LALSPNAPFFESHRGSGLVQPSFQTSFYSSGASRTSSTSLSFRLSIKCSFRWRPPFFIREKRRRFSASMHQMSGIFNEFESLGVNHFDK
jgi:hypothetical protein